MPLRRLPLLACVLLSLSHSKVSSESHWRQTGGCDPAGLREPDSDKPGTALVPNGASGFCECDDGRVVRMVRCEHEPFFCADECGTAAASTTTAAASTATVAATSDSGCAAGETCGAQAQRDSRTSPAAPEPATRSLRPEAQTYSCVGWRQTHQCNPEGQRDPSADKSCSTQIAPGGERPAAPACCSSMRQSRDLTRPFCRLQYLASASASVTSIVRHFAYGSRRATTQPLTARRSARARHTTRASRGVRRMGAAPKASARSRTICRATGRWLRG